MDKSSIQKRRVACRSFYLSSQHKIIIQYGENGGIWKGLNLFYVTAQDFIYICCMFFIHFVLFCLTFCSCAFLYSVYYIFYRNKNRILYYTCILYLLHAKILI